MSGGAVGGALRGGNGVRWLAAGLAVLALVGAASRAALRPPPPRPSTAPPEIFSAGRALATLDRLLGPDGGREARPVASAGNARFRQRVVDELRALGIEPVLQPALACGRYLACGPVANVVARVPGRSPGPAVLLATHLDTVPAGPGVADDASGVAILLEVARALRARPAAVDVLLLVDDGEEWGLIGADLFRRDPLARSVGAVVNLEARGTGGPSLLFEVVGDAPPVVRAASAGQARTLGSSLFAEVYRAIPNDTDLTVLRDLAVPGANLAFLDGGIRYHTPLDDRRHLEGASVQHQGEEALALVRGLADACRTPDEGEGASGASGAMARAGDRALVWFDLLGLAVVRYPASAALPLAVAALALAAAGAVTARRRKLAGGWRLLAGVALLPAGVAAGAAAALAADRALGLDPVSRPWVAHPQPLVAAALLAGLAGAALPALASRWVGSSPLRAGLRLALALAATAAAIGAPGASHLLLLPALVAGVAGVLPATCPGGRWECGGDVATSAAAALVLFPVAWLLYPALGHLGGVGTGLLVALAALPLAPLAAGLGLRARLALALIPVVLCAGATWLALRSPVADGDAPERVVLYFHQDADTGRARLLAHPDLGRLPPALRAAAPFSAEAQVPFGWGGLRPSFEAPVAPLGDGGPEVEVLERWRRGEETGWRARIRSRRGAPEVQLAIPPGVEIRSVRIDGVAVPRPAPKFSRWFGGWSVHRRLGLPAEGVEVEVVLAAPGPVAAVVADASPGLPAHAASVERARSLEAVPVQEGDTTLFTRAVLLGID